MTRFGVFLSLLLMLASQQLEPRPDLHLATGVHAARARERPTAGISVAITRRSPVPSVLRAFGAADVDGKVEATTNTVFRIAAVSNYIDAVLLMMLVDARKVALDEEVAAYLPNAPGGAGGTTVRQLMTLPSANFPLLRSVVEQVTGEPYASYAKKALFVPLRMTSSSICAPGETVTDAAAGYETKGGALIKVPVTGAAGHVCTTPRDLATLERELNAARVISRAGLGTMRSGASLPDGTSIDYGLGAAIGTLNGHRMVGHAGSGGGFSAALFTFPDDNLTIVVLTNTDNGGAATLAASIARSAFEIAAPTPADTAVPAAEASALAGTFASASGTTDVSPCGAKMCVRTPGQDSPRELRRQGPNVYVLDADVELRFPDTASPDWVFVYTGGLLTDARHRVRSR
jgi:D-alanyl-D-alanine carboxypeptidase